MNKFLHIGTVIFVALLLNSCSVNPVTGKKEIMLVSEGQELNMGAQSDPAIIQEYGLYPNQILQDFINEKGKMMGKISHRPNIDYQFRILDSPVVNAFAVPGGYVYFTRGILAHFNNEAEFAGVLGHEIGHVTARHSASQMSKQQLYGVGMMAGAILSEQVRNNMGALQQGLSMLFMKFSRDDESQSDELGVQYSTKIGYNSHYMADFFQVLKRIQEKSGHSIPTFQSTHPDPADRYNRVHQLTDNYQAQTGASNLNINRDKYLKMIDGLVYGEDPRQGFVDNNTFYHPELKFLFPVPQGWQYANSPAMFQMAEPNGKAMMVFTLSSKQNLQEAAQDAATQYKIQPVETKEIRVNNLPAFAMISSQQQKDQNGQVQGELKWLSYFIQYGQYIYAFHGLSTAQDFNNYFNTLTNTMSNFGPLYDQRIINIKPEKIKIHTVNTTTTLSNALMNARQDSKRFDEIAILNNMELNDQIQAGTLIKTLTRE